jgi:hypothetical protein
MATTSQEQTAGEQAALLIKRFFYADIAWTPNLAFHIGHMLAALKRQAKTYFPDKDVIYHCHMIASFTKEDMEDAFEAQKIKIKDFTEEVKCEKILAHGEPRNIGAMMK